jgi:hypothetical protein
MTEQTLLTNLSLQFPHLPAFDIALLARTVSPLSPIELRTLKLEHGDNAIMTAVIDLAIQQRETEAEIAALEERYEIYDEYRHCCGGW